MKIQSPENMSKFGALLAKRLAPSSTLELKGDVGVGKTTFTQGLATGLGIEEPVTSPSFTISKRYAFPGGELAHYDFYRLDEPGIMSEELLEDLANPKVITVIEWGKDVSELLPKDTISLSFTLNSDNSREVHTTNSLVENLWKTCGKDLEKSGKNTHPVENFSISCGKLSSQRRESEK